MLPHARVIPLLEEDLASIGLISPTKKPPSNSRSGQIHEDEDQDATDPVGLEAVVEAALELGLEGNPFTVADELDEEAQAAGDDPADLAAVFAKVAVMSEAMIDSLRALSEDFDGDQEAAEHLSEMIEQYEALVVDATTMAEGMHGVATGTILGESVSLEHVHDELAEQIDGIESLSESFCGIFVEADEEDESSDEDDDWSDDEDEEDEEDEEDDEEDDDEEDDEDDDEGEE